MTAEQAPMSALLDHTIGMVNQVTIGMDPDGGIPPILVTQGPRGVNLMQFAIPAGGDTDNETAYAITANIAVLRATEVVFVAGAWMTNPPRDDDGSGESSSPTEIVVILNADADRQRMMYADVIRHAGQSPLIGLWTSQPVGGTQNLGTFGEAIQYGLRLAEDLGKPEQQEARQVIEEILESDGTQAAMRVMVQIWRQARR